MLYLGLLIVTKLQWSEVDLKQKQALPHTGGTLNVIRRLGLVLRL